MTNWIKRAASLWPLAAKRSPEQKYSRARRLISLATTGNPVWTPRNYAAFAREGFAENAIGYRCVKMIAEAAASITMKVETGDALLDQHPLLNLLNNPNPSQSGRSLFESFYGTLQVSGNGYLEASMIDGDIRQLHVLRPDRMKVIPGSDGWPQAYLYSVNGTSMRFEQGDSDVPPIFHMASFNPLDDYYGMSAFEAAAKAIDIHNAASGWSKALLDNAARPSGALVYSDKEGSNLTDEQLERLKSELEASFQGAKNAGRPMVLEGGLEWKPISLTPKEMQHSEARDNAAREIAYAFGVPPMLLGIPGDNTFANYAEANRSFWRATILPLAQKTAQDLSRWLGPAFDGARLVCDIDQLPSLAGEREALWKRVSNADFLSDDEKRHLVGADSK